MKKPSIRTSLPNIRLSSQLLNFLYYQWFILTDFLWQGCKLVSSPRFLDDLWKMQAIWFFGYELDELLNLTSWKALDLHFIVATISNILTNRASIEIQKCGLKKFFFFKIQKCKTLGDKVDYFINCFVKNLNWNFIGRSSRQGGDNIRSSKLWEIKKVPPRFELGLLDSESNVLTTRPWDPCCPNSFTYYI